MVPIRNSVSIEFDLRYINIKFIFSEGYKQSDLYIKLLNMMIDQKIHILGYG